MVAQVMVTAGDGATPPPGPGSAGPGHGHRHRRRRRGQRPDPGPRRPERRPGRYPAARWPRSRATCSGRSAATPPHPAHRPGVPQPADSRAAITLAPSSWSPAAAAAPVPARRARTRSCLPEAPDERWRGFGLAHEAAASGRKSPARHAVSSPAFWLPLLCNGRVAEPTVSGLFARRRGATIIIMDGRAR